MELKYHHIGLPTTIRQEKEEYNAGEMFFASGYWDSNFGIEWLRFEHNSPLHPLIQTVPHVAFMVDDIEEAIKGRTVLLNHNPAQDVKVCFVEHHGVPIEFLQFGRPDHEIWPNTKKLINNQHPAIKTKIQYQYHHFCICINPNVNQPGVSINRADLPNNPFSLQFANHKINSSLPEHLQNISHVAFQVNDLAEAIKNAHVVAEPKKLPDGTITAFIEENGVPIELLQIDEH